MSSDEFIQLCIEIMLFELSHMSGSDVVEWLFHHIEGFHDRREARKYASNLLKAGFIRHTVNKITFSEQCYYVFGDLSDCENCEYLESIDCCSHSHTGLLWTFDGFL